jgi:hypothetical protein
VLAQVAVASVVATSSTAAAWTTVAAKVVGVVLIVGSVAGAVAVLPSTTSTRTRDVKPSPTAVAVKVLPVTASLPAPVVVATVAPIPVTQPIVQTPAHAGASSGAPPLAGGRPVAARASVVGSTIEEETRLFTEAEDALKLGDADGTLRLLDEHGARFPSSMFAPERMADRVFALCMAGRHDEARQAAADFLHVSSVGPLAARVRTSCGVSAH